MPKPTKSQEMTNPTGFGYEQLHEQTRELHPPSVEYSRLKEMLRREKETMEHQQKAKLPFRIGYFFLVVLIMGSFFYAVYGGYNQYSKSVAEEQSEVERCLERYTERSCSTASSLSSSSGSSECKILLECIRKKTSEGVLSTLWIVLSKARLI